MESIKVVSTPRILIVEDHPFQLVGIEMQLNRIGFFNLATVLDFDEALGLFSEGCYFDYLLCDLHLPDGNGLTLIECAYELGCIGHAILFSGVDDSVKLKGLYEEAASKRLPILACLSKPLRSEDILLALS